jgi:cytochrome P450 family 6
MGNFQGLGKTRHPAEITKALYDEWKGKSSFIGTYLFTTPNILVTDPELVKNVLVRDFDSFRNRGVYYNEKDDPLSAHLFTIEDKAWKDLRVKLTPTFTSGKMKMMFGTVLETADRLVDHLLPIASRGENFDIKDIVSRYSTDVIGSCAFGIECNSIENPEAEFRVNGRDFFNPGKLQQFKLFFGNAFPRLAHLLKIRAIQTHVSEFFIGAVYETLKYRKLNSVDRKDFMHLLLEIQKKHTNNSDKFADIDIAAQAFLFFLAGFETSGTTMSFALYELALHPEIQERLRSEINDVLKKHNNEISYEAINEMPYLDQVIDETLRKYPALENLLRKSTRDYLVPGTKHIIEKGTVVFIPVFGLHRDPEIFPNPEKFDPERFTDENKTKRHPFAYLPFGEGPRNCIGLRFGVMQTRLGLISVVRNFRVLPSADTPQTITLDKTTPILASEVPVMLKLQPL